MFEKNLQLQSGEIGYPILKHRPVVLVDYFLLCFNSTFSVSDQCARSIETLKGQEGTARDSYFSHGNAKISILIKKCVVETHHKLTNKMAQPKRSI